MIKRTIEISKEPAHLAVRLGQLLIRRPDAENASAPSIPCEDVGLLIVDQPQTSYSHPALVKLIDAGAVVVLCGQDHLPAALILPLSTHTELVWRIHDQIAASKPLCKRLWQQIVVAKIHAQAANLPPGSAARDKILALAPQVRSGDPENLEAQAAKIYWAAWLGQAEAAADFRRNADAPGLNAFLNYGYAVLRAALARALVAAGLHPALGIHHANRSNPFCLADDLLEPLRPLVDARVRDLNEWGLDTLDQRSKVHLLEILAANVRTGDQTGPLMVALHRMAASFVKCLRREEQKILIPLAWEPSA
jgi:CRISPR-associated protein Cas1